jgi:hypothetical protein
MVTLLTTGDPDESAQSAARQLMGRYTLEEAVQALAKNVEDIDVKVMLKDLKAKVLDGTVKAYAPAQVDISHTPVTVRSYYEEVEWDVLNTKWLTHFDAIGWRYPDPLDKLRPDWSYWNLDHLPLEDAISLSIDVTPEWTLFTKELGRKNVLHIQYQLVPRLKNALNWAQSPDCVWRCETPHEFKVTNQVKLVEFAKWAVKEKPDWKMPIEFKALARLDQTLSEQDKKRGKGRPPVLTENEVAELLQMRSDKPELSHDSLADIFQVSRRYVGQLLKRNGIN